MKAIKAFFSKVWAWVLAHKIVAGVIAGAVTLAIVTAIVVPVSVSSARKKRAAEETQQTDNGGSKPNSGDQGGSSSGGSGDSGGGGGDSTPAHTHVYGDLVPAQAATCEAAGHAAYYYCEGCEKYFDENKVETTLQALTVAATGHDYVFNSFVWAETPGAYTARAKYVCSHNAEHIEYHDAEMSHTTDAATHTANGANHWNASYDGHNDTMDEVLPSPGHSYNAVGLCLADGVFNGVTATVGEDTAAANYSAGQTYYFRIPATVGHTYSLQNAGVTPSETASYYLNSTGEPVAYDKSTTPFPVSGTFDNFIYFVHQPTGAENAASFRANFKSHEARADDFGFCQDHPTVYVGFDMDTNDLIDLDDMTIGQKAFRRFDANAYHRYGLNMPAPLALEDFAFAMKTDNGYQEFDMSNSSYATIPNFADLSVDDKVYIRVQPVADRVDPSFGVDEEHNYNYVGLCLYDSAYIGGNENTLEINEVSATLNYEPDDTNYYRVKAYAGHTYRFHPTSWVTAKMDAYYIQSDGMPIALGNMSATSNLIDFPEGSLDNYIYFIYGPMVSSGSGTFSVSIETHPVDQEHGACPHPGVTPTLENGVAYGSDFSIPAGGYAFFKALLSGIEVDQYNRFEISYGHDNYTYVTVWFKLNGTWTEFEAADGNVDYGEYDVADADQASWTDPDVPVVPDDGYIYIQMHNEGVSALAVTGAELGINLP